MNLIVIFMTCTCIVMHSLFCQLPNYNMFTQHVISLWRDTSSELWTPVHSFTFILPSTANTIYFLQALFYFTANKYLFPHCTSNHLFSANQWDWQPHCKLGQSSLVVLCAGSLVNHAPDCFLASCQSQLAITFRSDLFLLLVDSTLVSYWGEICCCAHHTFLLGFPNCSFETSPTQGLYRTLGEQSKKHSLFSSGNLQNNLLVLRSQLHRVVVKHNVSEQVQLMK
jgi:hypothetical protein